MHLLAMGLPWTPRIRMLKSVKTIAKLNGSSIAKEQYCIESLNYYSQILFQRASVFCVDVRQRNYIKQESLTVTVVAQNFSSFGLISTQMHRIYFTLTVETRSLRLEGGGGVVRSSDLAGHARGDQPVDRQVLDACTSKYDRRVLLLC